MAEQKLDLQELDQVLKRNTSELPNHLQGASFSVFNDKGVYHTFFLFLDAILWLVYISRY